jgi:hypothetical protein
VRFQLQGDQALETRGTFNDGQRHHVVTTVGAGGKRLHVDGKPIATGKLTKRTRTSNRLGPASSDATLTIDELQIFGHALAETEVIRLSDWTMPSLLVKPSYLAGLLALACAGASPPSVRAQAALTPWGNLVGLRVSGETVVFEAGLRLVHPDWTGFSSAAKYLQRPRYSRTGTQGIVESGIEGMAFKEVVTDTAPGEATLDLVATAKTNLSMAGVYFCVDLPDAEFAGGILEILPTGAAAPVRLGLAPAPPDGRGHFLRETSTGAKISAPRRTLELRWSVPMAVVLRRDVSDRPTSLNDPSMRQDFVTNSPTTQPAGYQVYLEVMSGHPTVGRTATASIELKACATPDPSPVRLVLDTTQPGRPFDGIGGNFRLQFPETDPAVLAYNLDNLRVAWGRLDMPWFVLPPASFTTLLGNHAP